MLAGRALHSAIYDAGRTFREVMMSDGREEREEQKKRRELEEREDREDQIDRKRVDEWEPERKES
jgi:hypothetical protein